MNSHRFGVLKIMPTQMPMASTKAATAVTLVWRIAEVYIGWAGRWLMDGQAPIQPNLRLPDLEIGMRGSQSWIEVA